jgi:hypothetical protein
MVPGTNIDTWRYKMAADLLLFVTSKQPSLKLNARLKQLFEYMTFADSACGYFDLPAVLSDFHWCHDFEHNDTQHKCILHNGIQHNGIQHNEKLNTTLSIMTLSIMTHSKMTLSITTLSIIAFSIMKNKTQHSAY